MESNDKLKKLILKVVRAIIDILIDEKPDENILVYNIPYKIN